MLQTKLDDSLTLSGEFDRSSDEQSLWRRSKRRTESCSPTILKVDEGGVSRSGPSRTISQPHSLNFVVENTEDSDSSQSSGNHLTLKGISRRGRSTERRLSVDDSHIPKETKLIKLLRSGICAYEKKGKKHIYGGTGHKIVSRLLKWLVTVRNRDDIFRLLGVYFNGSGLHINTKESLIILLSFWDSPILIQNNRCKNTTRSAIMLFLSYWWEKRLELDFVGEASEHLTEWLQTIPENYSKPLKSKYDRMVLAADNEVKTTNIINQTIFKLPQELGILDIDLTILAEHIKYRNVFMFLNIPLSELHSNDTSNLNNMMEYNANFTRWIVSCIVEKVQMMTRVKVLKKVLKLIKRLLALHDYNGAMCCWAAINSVSVYRLSKTFKRLPASSMDLLKSFRVIFSESCNFAQLRRDMEKSCKLKANMVPWIELINKGRNMIQEYPSTLNHQNVYGLRYKYANVPLYNFAKMEHLSELAEEVLKYQKTNQSVLIHATFSSNHAQLQEWFGTLPTKDEASLWESSLLCESEDTSDS